MSFKREGNDSNQLGILRKRRVRDLLGIAVPDDEALLMSNGRFACVVCGHRPVFDTVDMLILHRKGKKHVTNAEYEAERKDELEKLIEKRKHDQYIKDGTTIINQAPNNHRGLGISVPYVPRAKKPRLHDRKQKLDLTGPTLQEPVATGSSSLPGNRASSATSTKGYSDDKRAYLPKDQSNRSASKSTNLSNESFREIVLQHHLENGPVKHSKQLKKIFEENPKEVVIGEYKPYVSNRKQSGDFSKNVSESTFKQKPVTFLQSTRPHSIGSTSCQDNGRYSSPGCPVAMGDGKKSLKHSDILSLAKNPPPPPSSEKQEESATQQQRTAVSEEKKKKAEMYLQFRGAGWKKDLSGNWIRDEDAEFDSDEEPPDLP